MAIVLFLFLLIRILIVELRYILLDLMMLILEVGDCLVIEKVFYNFYLFEIGDIIVFELF